MRRLAAEAAEEHVGMTGYIGAFTRFAAGSIGIGRIKRRVVVEAGRAASPIAVERHLYFRKSELVAEAATQREESACFACTEDERAVIESDGYVR